VINWQMFIEKFINQQYLGVEAGTGIILNPFTRNVWFETKTGVVGDMRPRSFGDVLTSQTIFDTFGVTVPMHQVQIIRNDQLTSFESDVIIGGVHTIVDEYEHLVLFENYAFERSRRKLIYDPFLGVRVNRMHFATERQAETNGRLSFGGHYISKDKVKRNIEASVTDILNYYDADKMIDQSQTARYARCILGYDSKQYMTDIDMSDKTQFGFWRGLIHNKGSNSSVDAFLNSSRFESAKIDEFWAYKLASYGDARKLQFPEIKISPNDTTHNFMKLQFTDGSSSIQPGFTAIKKNDESRWMNLEDAETDMFFNAEVLAEIPFEYILANKQYDLEMNGKQILADTVEVYEWVSLKTGDMTPYLIRVNNFELINSTTIKFLDVPLDYSIYIEPLGFGSRKFVVKCFGPSQPKFNPAKLIDYKNKVVLSDIELWDPARGAHVPEALEIVDMISPNDPAKYNYSVLTNTPEYEPLRPWGVKDIGRTWWNTKNLAYIPYSDTKIFPKLDTRLSYWGSLADWSSVSLNEWVESSVHPSKYADLVKKEEGNADIDPTQRASGEVADPKVYIRTRTWQQRPIVWAYTNTPGSIVPYVEAIGEYSVEFALDPKGNNIAILSNSDWTTAFEDLAIGMKLSGGFFHYDPTNTADPDNFKLDKPYGEAIITGLNLGLVIGSSTSTTDGTFMPPTYSFDPDNPVTDVTPALLYTVTDLVLTQNINQNKQIVSASNANDVVYISSSTNVGTLPDGMTLQLTGTGPATALYLVGSPATIAVNNLVLDMTDSLGRITRVNVQVTVQVATPEPTNSISVAPNAVNVTATEGIASTNQTVTVTNTGDTVQIVTVTYTTPSGVTLTANYTNFGGSPTASIQPGASKSFMVAYTGSTAGSYVGAIHLASNTVTSNIPVNLTVNVAGSGGPVYPAGTTFTTEARVVTGAQAYSQGLLPWLGAPRSDVPDGLCRIHMGYVNCVTQGGYGDQPFYDAGTFLGWGMLSQSRDVAHYNGTNYLTDSSGLIPYNATDGWNIDAVGGSVTDFSNFVAVPSGFSYSTDPQLQYFP
jgi:hypothetical protein